MGAQRVGLKRVILPWGNRREVEGVFASDSSESETQHGLAGEANEAREVGVEMKKDLKCVFVKSVREAVDEAFGKGVLVWRGASSGRSTGSDRGVHVQVGSDLGVGRKGIGDEKESEGSPGPGQARVPVRVPVLDESRL